MPSYVKLMRRKAAFPGCEPRFVETEQFMLTATVPGQGDVEYTFYCGCEVVASGKKFLGEGHNTLNCPGQGCASGYRLEVDGIIIPLTVVPVPRKSLHDGTTADVKKRIWERLRSLLQAAAMEQDTELFQKLSSYKRELEQASRDQLGALLREIDGIGKRSVSCIAPSRIIGELECRAKESRTLSLLGDLQEQVAKTRCSRKVSELLQRAQEVAGQERRSVGKFHTGQINRPL